MTNLTWSKVAAGHYRCEDLGVDIERVDNFNAQLGPAQTVWDITVGPDDPSVTAWSLSDAKGFVEAIFEAATADHYEDAREAFGGGE